MRASHFILVVAVSAAALNSVHAQTYRWIDEHGVVNFSQELPAPESGIQELSVVEGTATVSPFEQRALELINEERRALAQQRAAAASEAAGQPMTQSGVPGAMPSSLPSSGAAAMRARATAARDPCLLSPDPRCFEKNARNYDPYHGYTPAHSAASSTTVGAPGAPTGASGIGNAGGQVAGAVSVPVRAAEPGSGAANTANR
jgi:hypothetical protein